MLQISTISELIDALGGPSELGAFLGITQEAVSNWKARGAIPPGWHARLILEARKRSIIVDGSVFGLVGDPAAELRNLLSAGEKQPSSCAAA